ncbi:indolepyruvate oxidoreductase subunit beta family protein [Xenorhabdus sp. IM139775]|uniref:indolepyruvate oxidoreductase subunit beta family protein n=1 Tax=Xenorhabdus sp. IM139775 TaxID=3025876 RepID=UPI0023587630|nr:indolepyruvate oxidoreductase subunit beta family protein [Xenorhabdus sp. IM139775]MDC9593901.1 indolepyruvate oxidoreductase subunit beta family protein [Xenorhabdus sp. IM139775]
MPLSNHSQLTTALNQPIKIAILAMGGEGGGVLADWLVTLGEENGYFAQTTSVPGVAQRTGATIYYVELFPVAAGSGGSAPVLALMPTAGDVDIVLASELMEAGRAVQRGFVTPDRTTLIASSHRVFSMGERSAMGDGRVDSGVLIRQSRQAALRFIYFDMARVAEKSGSVISAVLFGALCGAEILPFTRHQFEAAIIKKKVGITPSLQAFSLGLSRAQSEAKSSSAGKMASETPAPNKKSGSHNSRSHNTLSHNNEINALLLHIRQKIPPCIHDIVIEGVRRLIDYQDPAYARLYLDRLQKLIKQAVRQDEPLLGETARHLALWMAYEDTIRVADLKTRVGRFERIKQDMRTRVGQLIEIKDFLHPRMAEICDILPASFGRWLSRPHVINRLLEKLLSRGRVMTTSSIPGYLLLYILAHWRRMRRHTLRFQHETVRIEGWLWRIGVVAKRDPDLALEIAQCQRLIKGYGETHARGLSHFQTLMAIVDHHLHDLSPASLRQLREAALADEQGDQLRACQRRLSLY